MVNFHDPAVLALDFCEYEWVFCFRLSSKIPRGPLFSGPLEAQSHVGWSLHVRLHCARPLRSHLVLWGSESDSRKSITPDGSSSRLLTTSGMSSKDVYATDGRYGYVFKFDGLFWGDTVFFPGTDFLLSLG